MDVHEKIHLKLEVMLDEFFNFRKQKKPFWRGNIIGRSFEEPEGGGVSMITGNPESRKRFKRQKRNSCMNSVIVDEETFIASFGSYQYNLARKYLLACELNKTVKNRSEIARRVSHSKKSVSSWIAGRHLPRAIRALNFLKSINLMPLREDTSREFVLFTELAGFLFGDGHLMRQLGSFTLSGQKDDLQVIRKRLIEVYSFESKLNYFETDSYVLKLKDGKTTKRRASGACWRLSVNSSALARLFYLAGVPAGDKVSLSTRVPFWVMHGCKETKRAFLSVLFGNELQCPCLRAKNAFSSPYLAFHKVEEKAQDMKAFLLQIKTLLREFGVSTSSVKSENSLTIRKDGSRSRKLYFSMDSHSPNILQLYREIPFKYAKEKQSRFAEAAKKFIQNSCHLKKEWALYETVIALHDKGLGRRTIFKQLELPRKYFYKINHWIHYGRKPLYYNERALLLSSPE